ncbi:MULTISPECIES: NUDIX domain-containing protein [unclassified Micromonospora]|uniref:NUDIX domain-containing protein n=1 Tax=unclassified Micromonospora TaxID=2617518 RepID=UPI001C2343C6|nr:MULTISPECIES: NUDIX domain-containing protein [unclassified Micromonospora]MBU8858040.1 NUDIX domain-containing protein [Micromonospora sp. WMMB482]MDM4783675.1 NUDIX domain-containing protein [Micromonospora sp. b486]
MREVLRRSVRAILWDDLDRLVLIKRTRPGQNPYWTAPGGGLEPTDASLAAALRRELREELGAEVEQRSQVFLFSSPSADGVSVQHFISCRLTRVEESARTGPEFTDPSRGGYAMDRVGVDRLPEVDLKPEALKDFILANTEALLSEFS